MGERCVEWIHFTERTAAQWVSCHVFAISALMLFVWFVFMAYLVFGLYNINIGNI